MWSRQERDEVYAWFDSIGLDNPEDVYRRRANLKTNKHEQFVGELSQGNNSESCKNNTSDTSNKDSKEKKHKLSDDAIKLLGQDIYIFELFGTELDHIINKNERNLIDSLRNIVCEIRDSSDLERYKEFWKGYNELNFFSYKGTKDNWVWVTPRRRDMTLYGLDYLAMEAHGLIRLPNGVSRGSNYEWAEFFYCYSEYKNRFDSIIEAFKNQTIKNKLKYTIGDNKEYHVDMQVFLNFYLEKLKQAFDRAEYYKNLIYRESQNRQKEDCAKALKKLINKFTSDIDAVIDGLSIEERTEIMKSATSIIELIEKAKDKGDAK